MSASAEVICSVFFVALYSPNWAASLPTSLVAFKTSKVEPWVSNPSIEVVPWKFSKSNPVSAAGLEAWNPSPPFPFPFILVVAYSPNWASSPEPLVACKESKEDPYCASPFSVAWKSPPEGISESIPISLVTVWYSPNPIPSFGVASIVWLKLDLIPFAFDVVAYSPNVAPSSWGNEKSLFMNVSILA